VSPSSKTSKVLKPPQKGQGGQRGQRGQSGQREGRVTLPPPRARATQGVGGPTDFPEENKVVIFEGKGKRKKYE